MATFRSACYRVADEVESVLLRSFSGLFIQAAQKKELDHLVVPSACCDPHLVAKQDTPVFIAGFVCLTLRRLAVAPFGFSRRPWVFPVSYHD